MRWLRSACSAWALLACAGSAPPSAGPPPPWHDRRDYEAFREEHPELLEPNYLPFMAHRASLGGEGGDVLLLCRWDARDLPLAYAIEPPRIPAELEDEFDPKPPEEYVRSVARAFATWERELEGLVRFERRDAPPRARLVVRLLGDRAPLAESDVKVLGTTPLGGACRPQGGAAADGVLPVRYAAPEVRIYVADEFGLLNPDQVYRVALHEIGHALGMRGHSPVPADLMYEVARDRALAESLSAADVNSFVSLYRLPSGTLYATLPPEGPPAPPPPRAPSGAPRLAVSPHVDARFGFELRVPEGWMRVETRRGVALVDGVSWDYDASLQVIALEFPSVEAYLERYGAAHLAGGLLRERQEVRVAGHRGLRLVVEGRGGPGVEEVTLVEAGERRLFLVIADCPSELYDGYRPWFRAALDSLEIVPRGAGRGVAPAP